MPPRAPWRPACPPVWEEPAKQTRCRESAVRVIVRPAPRLRRHQSAQGAVLRTGSPRGPVSTLGSAEAETRVISPRGPLRLGRCRQALEGFKPQGPSKKQNQVPGVPSETQHSEKDPTWNSRTTVPRNGRVRNVTLRPGRGPAPPWRGSSAVWSVVPMHQGCGSIPSQGT